jgi:hypothetical protein
MSPEPDSSKRHIAVLKRKTHVAMSMARKTAKLARGDGVSVAARYVWNSVRGIISERLGPARPPKTNVLDKQYGTDTAESVKLHGLDIRSPNYQHAIYYRATDFPILSELLNWLDLRHEDYTFIDYGSGKGLVLLQAARFPFKKIIGVEFARELHEVASRNLDRHPAHLRRSEIELVHGDAVEFTPPAGDLVLYLYEPFEAPVTRQIIARIREFHLGRNVVVAYVWSKNASVTCKAMWDAAPFLTTIHEGDGWTIYRAIA